jgi:hypothetical protein
MAATHAMGARNKRHHSAFCEKVRENIMNDLDHMLNGNASRQHHQDMIRQAQHAKIARELKSIKGSGKTAIPLPVMLTALIHLIMWWKR